MSVRFVADAADAVCRVQLDGLTALFHRPSGQTHILVSPAPEILDALGDSPADLPTLIARLSERFELGADADAAVAARLGELETAGLVRRT